MSFTTDAVRQQLEELQLIQATLLPDELLAFLDEDGARWSRLLREYGDAVDPASISGHGSAPAPSAAPRIRVKPQHASVWFEVQFPGPGSGNPRLPAIAVKGENMSRAEQQRWQHIIQERLEMDEITTSDFPVYQLLCLHLLPLLHDAVEVPGPAPAEDASKDEAPPPAARFHALFTSHHLVSPKKRRALQQWAGALAVAGFAKVGYPGVIYAQGAQPGVEEFVASVKAMQWLALRLRFVEPLPRVAVAGGGGEARGWTEYEKVGEAVEAMRGLGLERWIVEMGVGSKSTG
ncbi:hypothetical protein GGX14DRAFT_635247 [Mycena pura]|uniref:Uncharacterized protein n=1 Tax=Mycena pura TaxID=153505 RepID=A0AAD6VBI3_9AGAR|nr:hypothetical protein GGX14DRAFT_635247 [Mycena pura]